MIPLNKKYFMPFLYIVLFSYRMMFSIILLYFYF